MFMKITKEDLEEIVAKTIHQYVTGVNFSVGDPSTDQVVDAVVGSTLLAGMSIMTDLLPTIVGSGLSRLDVKEVIASTGGTFGYTSAPAGGHQEEIE